MKYVKTSNCANIQEYKICEITFLLENKNQALCFFFFVTKYTSIYVCINNHIYYMLIALLLFNYDNTHPKLIFYFLQHIYAYT